MEGQPSEINIERKSPRITLKIGERTLLLDWYNTTIRIYRAPYGHFNHIAVDAPDQATRGLFLDSDYQSRFLMAHNFPIHYEPEPDDQVLGILSTQWDKMIDGGLDKLLGGEGSA